MKNENIQEYPERKYMNWIYHIPGLGRKKTGVILKSEDGGTAEKNAEKIYHMKRDELRGYLQNECSFSEKTALAIEHNIILMESKISPEALWSQMSENKITFMFRGDGQYPHRLQKIPDPPIVLYMKGKRENGEQITGVKNNETGDIKIKRPVLAVVGARNCSEYGKYVAAEIGRKCAKTGIAVISGLAVGVDGTAQWNAIKEQGMVAAVLGCGVDICYPYENKKIYDRLILDGCVYSEYVPGTKPRANHFPSRNRIISGMADAVVVVEAKEKSGTLITVDMALEQSREVYIIPGRITDALSFGCNSLIRQGASIVCNIEDMLAEICEKVWTQETVNLPGVLKIRKKCAPDMIYGNPYEPGEIRYKIYSVLDTEYKSVQCIYEELVRKKLPGIQIPDIQTIQTELFFMQMDGKISEKEGRFGIAYFKST